MANDDYELLIMDGINVTDMGVTVAVLTADYGDGYGDGALVGSPEGLRDWMLSISALVNFDDEFLIFTSPTSSGEPRGDYLWNFFLRSKAAGNRPFRFQNPTDGMEYFAEFVDKRLSYRVFTSKVFSAEGIAIRQRRVRDFESPVDPGDNPDEI